ncbi:MAG: hypothetical protein ACRELX_12355 [Longimicrobiales bacterium]
MVRLNRLRTGMAAGVIAASLFAACDRADQPIITREISGSWSTTAGSYSDRGFVITRDSLHLHQGGGIIARHRIRGIRRVRRNDRVAYTIRYDGIVRTLDFRFDYYAAPSGPYIHIRNQPRAVTWHRGERPDVEGVVAVP